MKSVGQLWRIDCSGEFKPSHVNRELAEKPDMCLTHVCQHTLEAEEEIIFSPAIWVCEAFLWSSSSEGDRRGL